MGGWGGKIIIIIRIVSVKKGWEVEKKIVPVVQGNKIIIENCNLFH